MTIGLTKIQVAPLSLKYLRSTKLNYLTAWSSSWSLTGPRKLGFCEKFCSFSNFSVCSFSTKDSDSFRTASVVTSSFTFAVSTFSGTSLDLSISVTFLGVVSSKLVLGVFSYSSATFLSCVEKRKFDMTYLNPYSKVTRCLFVRLWSLFVESGKNKAPNSYSPWPWEVYIIAKNSYNLPNVWIIVIKSLRLWNGVNTVIMEQCLGLV